ncbi:MAG TPA: hypothetical protein VF195_13115 [Actinomycetota bacterium]
MSKSAFRLSVLVVGLVAAAILATPTAALAHGEPPGSQDEPSVMPEPEPQGQLERLRVVLDLPEEASVGGATTIRAVVTHREDGDPVEGLMVTFEAPATWGEALAGSMVLGTAVTDHDGTAVIATEIRAAGDLEVTARVESAEGFREASTTASLEVVRQRQVVEDEVGLRIPWLNLWVLAGVIGLVWLLYLTAAGHLRAIARQPDQPPDASPTQAMSRRTLLGRSFPLAVQAGIAAFGAGLIGIVVRSPRTHGNLLSPPGTEAYRRTPVAFVGRSDSMREMPTPLDRPVSFRDEVLPVFMRFGGPHVVQPEHSPPPGRLQLDSWAHLMEAGVVVPGKPEESELVEHLLSPGMQMPPSRPPLPDDTIQLIVTWVAQGAQDN